MKLLCWHKWIYHEDRKLSWFSEFFNFNKKNAPPWSLIITMACLVVGLVFAFISGVIIEGNAVKSGIEPNYTISYMFLKIALFGILWLIPSMAIFHRKFDPWSKNDRSCIKCQKHDLTLTKWKIDNEIKKEKTKAVKLELEENRLVLNRSFVKFKDRFLNPVSLDKEYADGF